MGKTRNQTEYITIKKEEEEDCKPSVLLNGTDNTRSNNKITKTKPAKSNSKPLSAQDVKIEEDTDNKSLLKPSSNYSNSPKGQKISQEQINQLIDAIINDNMSITKAACKANMCRTTARYYYNQYKNDPEKKIPVPRTFHQRVSTTEHIENLIRYINDDKMSITKASAKANMNYDSGRYYYRKYLKDHNIPILHSHQRYTQDQKNEFIGYIVNDKMSISAASKKAKMSDNAGRDYFHKYFQHQNPDIPVPSHLSIHKCYTQEEIKKLINYIIDDKMSIEAASRKANIVLGSARKHYRQYLKDNNMGFPMSKSRKRFTLDEKNPLIRYIVEDKMSITAASKKANISYTTGFKYYKRYLMDQNLDPLALKHRQDKIKEIARYMVNDKMTMKAASERANIPYHLGYLCYREYLNSPKA